MLNPDQPTEAESFFGDIPEKLKKEWENIPENYASVYHFTRPEALKGISEKGLRHYSDFTPEGQLDYYQQVKIRIDRIFDQVAIELGIGHKRSGSVFASPEFIDEKQTMGKGNVPLEIKVDPQRVIISDGRLVTAAANSWLKTPDGHKWFKAHPEFIAEQNDKELFEKLQAEFQGNYLDYISRYWKEAVTLDEWNHLSAEQKGELFNLPEVVIEGGIDSDFIRVKEN